MSKLWDLFIEWLLGDKKQIGDSIAIHPIRTILKFILVIFIAIVGIIFLTLLTDAANGAYSYINNHFITPLPPTAESASDAQICAQTENLTDSMMAFQNNMKVSEMQLEQQSASAWDSATSSVARQQAFYRQDQAMMKLDDQNTYNFRTTLLSEATTLKDQLLQRLATSSVPTTTPDGTPTNELIAFQGQLAGASPVEDAAVYLQELAKELCPNNQ